jgi:hypothetical protein
MLNRRFFFPILFCVTCTTGCNLQSILDRIAPETTQEAKTNFDYLRHHQYDKIEASLDPSITINRAGLEDSLARMAALIPAEEPVSVKEVGAYRNCETRKGCSTQVTLEYQFPSQWVLVQLVTHSQDGHSSITSFYVRQEAASLEEINRFRLIGEHPLQYVILAAAIGSLALMVYALVLCVRTPKLRSKWLWILLILVGVGQVIVNWTTGEVDYHIVYLNIPPGWISRQLYGPWTVFACVPLGALAFLVFRERLEVKPKSYGDPLSIATTGPHTIPRESSGSDSASSTLQ